MLVGSTIVPFAGVMVMPAVAFATFAALAVIVTDPAATPVTGTDTLVPPTGKLIVPGTVAIAVLLELRVILSGVTAGSEKFSMRFCVAGALIVRLAGQKLIVVWGVPPEFTWTCVLAVT